MTKNSFHGNFTQRQLRVGELVKQNLGQIFLKNEAKSLYDSYIINRKHKLPFVVAKIAISKNKIIYSKRTKRITNMLTDKLTHYLRFKNDAIMISSKTLNIDNPKLNCRLKGYENFSPKRIVLDKDLKINLNTYIFRSTKKNNTIIFHSHVVGSATLLSQRPFLIKNHL